MNKSNIIQFVQYCSYILILCILAACQQKDEIGSRPYPRVRTISVEETAEGTIFTGEIFFSDGTPITNHGFEYFTLKEPSTGFSATYEKPLGPKPGSGTFSTIIANNLQKNGNYSLRAYAATGKYKVFGTTLTFSCKNGSLAAQLLSVTPAVASRGEIITITGKNFNSNYFANTIYFDNIAVRAAEASETTVKVVVPASLTNTAPVKITLRTGDRSVSKENAFQLTQ